MNKLILKFSTYNFKLYAYIGSVIFNELKYNKYLCKKSTEVFIIRLRLTLSIEQLLKILLRNQPNLQYNYNQSS